MPYAGMAAIKERNDFGCAVELVLEVPWESEAEPGQFVHVRCGGNGRILRRPFSITVSRLGEPAILVRPVGDGTRWLCSRKAGEEIDILGPLGKGFSVLEAPEHVLVAGGAGIAPLRFLALRLRERGHRASLLWGMEEAFEYGILPDILAEECELALATRDGKKGFEGSVLELFHALGKENDVAIYVCGPRDMHAELMRSLGKDALKRTQVSVEERMACGVGACRGCAVPSATCAGGYVLACREGPVFFAGDVDWERF